MKSSGKYLLLFLLFSLSCSAISAAAAETSYKTFIILPCDEINENTKFSVRYIIPPNFTNYRILDINNDNSLHSISNVQNDIIEREYLFPRKGTYSVTLLFYNNNDLVYIEEKAFKIKADNIDLTNYIYMGMGSLFTLLMSIVLFQFQKRNEIVKKRKYVIALYKSVFNDLLLQLKTNISGIFITENYKLANNIDNMFMLPAKIPQESIIEIFHCIENIKNSEKNLDDKREMIQEKINAILKLL